MTNAVFTKCHTNLHQGANVIKIFTVVINILMKNITFGQKVWLKGEFCRVYVNDKMENMDHVDQILVRIFSVNFEVFGENLVVF